MRRTPLLGAGLGLAFALAGLSGAAGTRAEPIAANSMAEVQRTAVFELFGRDT